METINNMAKAAATAVWGETNTTTTSTTEEPKSGAQGDVSKGEPFDKGNEEDIPSTASKTTESNTKTTESAEFAKNSGTAAETDKTPQTASAELKEKRDAPADTTKGQNDIRDPEDPKTHPKNAPNDVDDTKTDGEGLKGGQKLDGPGPAPLEEVAKKHGGDAGNSSTETSGKPGADDEDEDGPKAKSKGEGTGEQYVKSSGLAADGGDFDATKPGAGREADRLLEEKGISHNKPTSDKNKPADEVTPSKTASKSSDSADKEKKSLKDKIKDKFSRNKDE